MKNISENIKQLSKTILFKNIKDEDIASVLTCLSPELREYKKEQTIINEGDKVTNIGIVLSGSVYIQKIDYWGNTKIKARIDENEIFGETFACLNTTRANCQAYAQTDCRIMFLNVDSLLHTCSPACPFHNMLLHNFLNVLAMKNFMLSQKIEILTQKSTREKLMEFLTQQAKANGSDEFTIPFNRQQLADYLSVDRSAMSQEISKLTKEGIIETDRNHFRLI